MPLFERKYWHFDSNFLNYVPAEATVVTCTASSLSLNRFRVVAAYAPQGVQWFNTLRLRQNGSHLVDDVFIYISLNENIGISNDISLKCVPCGLIDNISLVQIMAWRRIGNKPLPEPIVV